MTLDILPHRPTVTDMKGTLRQPRWLAATLLAALLATSAGSAPVANAAAGGGQYVIQFNARINPAGPSPSQLLRIGFTGGTYFSTVSFRTSHSPDWGMYVTDSANSVRALVVQGPEGTSMTRPPADTNWHSIRMVVGQVGSRVTLDFYIDGTQIREFAQQSSYGGWVGTLQSVVVASPTSSALIAMAGLTIWENGVVVPICGSTRC